MKDNTAKGFVDNMVNVVEGHDTEVRLKREGAKEAMDSVHTVWDLFMKQLLLHERFPLHGIRMSETMADNLDLLVVRVPTDFNIAFDVVTEENKDIDLSPLYDHFQMMTENNVYTLKDYDSIFSVTVTSYDKGISFPDLTIEDGKPKSLEKEVK